MALKIKLWILEVEEWMWIVEIWIKKKENNIF